MNHYQDQAIAAIKRKDYNAAVQHYNKAINRAESAKLYDARASCYTRLKDLPAALNDAKKCIQIAKTDPIGYLRAGKVLMAMDKKSVALEVMARGLRTVKHAGQGYETLQSTHNALMHKIKPVHSIDPMTVLPRELAIAILAYLDFKQLMNICSVSMAWNGLVRSVPELWEHLDFSKARPQLRLRVRDDFIKRAIAIARGNIKRATLNNMVKTEIAIQRLIQQCPTLESLHLLAVPRLSPSFGQMLRPAHNLKSLHFPMDQENGSAVVRQVLETLENRLEDFSCRMFVGSLLSQLLHQLRMPRLKTLNMLCQTGQSLPLDSMPALQSLTLQSPGGVAGLPLDLYDFQSLQQLQHIDIVCGQLQFCRMKLPQALKTLKVKCWRSSSDNLADYLVHDWPSFALPQLEVLDLSMAFVTDVNVISQALSEAGSTRLRRLTLTPFQLPDDDASLELYESFCSQPQLEAVEHIGWPNAIGWNDDFITVMVKKFPKLSSIDLTSTKVTGVGVQAALQARHLNELILDDCPDLGLDAVQWARRKGVRVRNRSAEALRHERTIKT